MSGTGRGGERAAAAIVAGAAWIGLGLQAHLTIARCLSKGMTAPQALVFYFSFFTILTNLAVAVSLSVPLLWPRGGFSRRIARPGVRAALVADILLVGIAYSALLRHEWHPRGLQFVADELLHDVVPPAYLLHWACFAPKGVLRGVGVLTWLVYPLVYFAWALLYGGATGKYPYSFIDVEKLGWGKVLLDALGLVGGFLAISLGVVAFDRLRSRGVPEAPPPPS